ncbi:hypothetical protein ACGF5F_32885 [Streptomyces sp. NPDC047821]|uniref:hypothetical protein n=1 Tax=Streptomyces sp. NPDC047821 TaxID=3365488 RepID=UPI0037173FFC
MAAQRLHPCADLLGDGLRQRGQHPLDPGQITVLVQSGIVDEQATSAQELADGLGGEVAVEACQVVDVALVEGVLDSEPVAQDREGANVLVEACSLLVAPLLGEVVHERCGCLGQRQVGRGPTP